jgi:branched-subunit amino acid aminotransferase/4-amino-4-deoxychorismate lyase
MTTGSRAAGQAHDDDDRTPACRYLYRAGHGLLPAAGLPADAGPAPLAAADSWLVAHGRVRALDRHQLRFAQACAAAGRAGPDRFPGPDDLARFWSAVVARLPRTGCWFPRVELAGPGTAELRLLLRPAPPLGTTARLWLGDTADRRRMPRRKGPDLGRLTTMRDRAVAAGADDALLTTPGGIVLEGATTSLLWWEDGCLCLPSPGLRTVPGVTSGLLAERARELAIPVARRRVTVGGLAGREVWAVNALHGLRPVIGWAGSGGGPGTGPGAATRAPAWRRWLQEAAAPLPSTA